MKYIIIIALLTIVASCSIRKSQSHISVEESKIQNYRDERGYKQGKWRYYHKGMIYELRTYKNDTLDGNYIKYHENGKVSIEGSYREGLKNGTWHTYDNSGRITYIQNYVAGLPDGHFRAYHWFTDVVSREGNYKQGKKHGVFREYTIDGELFKEEKYHMGVLVDSKQFLQDDEVYPPNRRGKRKNLE